VLKRGVNLSAPFLKKGCVGYEGSQKVCKVDFRGIWPTKSRLSEQNSEKIAVPFVSLGDEIRARADCHGF